MRAIAIRVGRRWANRNDGCSASNDAIALGIWRVTRGFLLGGGLLAATACKDLTGDPGLPAGTPDPALYQSADGARGLRVAALYEVDYAIPQYLIDTGLLSDELQDPSTNASAGTLLQAGSGVLDPLDERILPDGSSGGSKSYSLLQNIRGKADLALGALATYDTAAADQPAQQIMRGELLAMQGYAEILLAELMCSGVPLSTLDFHGDFTYAPSSTAMQVYHDASSKLDHAMVLAAASDSIVNLARVLKGRAQLDLGNYSVAADDVMTVPATFQYRVTIDAMQLSAVAFPLGSGQSGTVSDKEGGNGLPFRSDVDLRTATTVTCTPPGPTGNNCLADTLRMPAKYMTNLVGGHYTRFVVASGIEAQLIQSEAQLQAQLHGIGAAGVWLTTLNVVRTSSGLPPLSDPGSDADRIALLFRERAYWLFMTGHRQGDLRRVLRQYSQYPAFRSESNVYPTGAYTAPGTGRYGTDVTVPIPTSEFANPNYHGCLDRNP